MPSAAAARSLGPFSRHDDEPEPRLQTIFLMLTAPSLAASIRLPVLGRVRIKTGNPSIAGHRYRD